MTKLADVVEATAALSGARPDWENKLANSSVKGVSIPVAVSIFPDDLSSPEELGAARVSQTHPLQQARQRRTLRGLRTAGTLFPGVARGLQITARIAQ